MCWSVAMPTGCHTDATVQRTRTPSNGALAPPSITRTTTGIRIGAVRRSFSIRTRATSWPPSTQAEPAADLSRLRVPRRPRRFAHLSLDAHHPDVQDLPGRDLSDR